MTVSRDFCGEIMDALKKYAMDKQKPELSEDSRGYLKHCIGKAFQKVGSEATVLHHQMFFLMSLEHGEELTVEFLKALELTNQV